MRRFGLDRGVAALVIVMSLVARAPVSAAAQVATNPTTTTTTVAAADTTTTTTTASTTTTTTAPINPPPVTAPTGTTATTTAPPSSTTVTAPAGTTTANVPGPPPPPAPPAGTTPADIAKAAQLDAEIVTNSNLLDILAERYDQAEQAVQDTATTLSKIQGDLTANQANVASMDATVASAEASLHDLAIEAYVRAGGLAPTVNEGVSAYLDRLSNIAVETSLSRAQQKVQQLHTAQRQLKGLQAAIDADRQQATLTAAAAQTAAAQAQTAAQGAASQQALLLGSVSQIKGNLTVLVAAAHTLQAQAAFIRFSASNLLDFRPSGPPPPPLAQAAAVVQAAEAQVGKPYVWGATGPDTFDCSGLTQWTWAQSGVHIPRVAADQQTWTVPVPISQLAIGDLVFYGAPAHHVGMYVGNGMMVNAPHSGATVEVVPIWWNDLTGFGRVHQP